MMKLVAPKTVTAPTIPEVVYASSLDILKANGKPSPTKRTTAEVVNLCVVPPRT